MFGVRSFSDDSFCFWTGEEGAPLMQATVYEDNIPSEITDPETQLDCIHILDLNNSEGKVKISDVMKYGFHATETPDFLEIKVFLNNNEVYYGNSVIQMPLISESDMNQNKVIFARAFTVWSELMAVTYTRDYFRLHCADVESRFWEKSENGKGKCQKMTGSMSPCRETEPSFSPATDNTTSCQAGSSRPMGSHGETVPAINPASFGFLVK